MAGNTPRLSVAFYTRNRRESLAACLNALERQSLDADAFEVAIADFGSTDDTRAFLANLESSLQIRVIHEDSGDRIALRNRMLGICTGEIVMFIEADCVPSAGCLAHHVQRHMSSAGTGPIAILGNAHLPGGSERFALSRYVNDLNAKHRTANPTESPACTVFSAPLAEVRAIGGFDQRLTHGDAANRDLFLRLQAAGLRIEMDQDACAAPSDQIDFDVYRQSRVSAARGLIALYHKHPELLQNHPDSRLSFIKCHAKVREEEERTRLLEETAHELATIDLQALEILEDSGTPVARTVYKEFTAVMDELESAWANIGTLQGLRDEGLAQLQELAVTDSSSDPFATTNPRRLFAWPCWSDRSELDELMERIAPIARDGFATLVLRHDAQRDPEQKDAISALQSAYAKHYPEDTESSFEVLIESGSAEKHDYMRWGRAVSAFLPLGSEPRSFVRALGAESLDSASAVEDWRRRFEPITA